MLSGSFCRGFCWCHAYGTRLSIRVWCVRTTVVPGSTAVTHDLCFTSWLHTANRIWKYLLQRSRFVIIIEEGTIQRIKGVTTLVPSLKLLGSFPCQVQLAPLGHSIDLAISSLTVSLEPSRLRRGFTVQNLSRPKPFPSIIPTLTFNSTCLIVLMN